jgi:hypothetical protein
MHIAPQSLSQLKRGDNLTGVGSEQTEGGKFPGRQVNHGFSAKESAIGLEPESSKGERRLVALATGVCRSGARCLIAW